jgi:hypothetical protein
MKDVLKIAAAVSFLALASASGAMAQATASGTVNVTATILATCTINGGAIGTAQTKDFSNTTALPSATISTSAQTVSGVWAADCNTPTHISLSSANGASITGAAATSGWQNFFDYTAVASISGTAATNTLNTSSNPATGAAESTALNSGTASAGPAAGDLQVLITPATPANKLVAGAYSDVLTVTLTAN